MTDNEISTEIAIQACSWVFMENGQLADLKKFQLRLEQYVFDIKGELSHENRVAINETVSIAKETLRCLASR